MTLKKKPPCPWETERIRASLATLLASQRFRARPKISDLLEFLVEEALADRASRLKGYTLGLEVFKRGADFDPESDAIVRVGMNRLRRMLDEYYQQEGQGDPVRIQFAKGSYAPCFVQVSAAAASPQAFGKPITLGVEPLEWIGGGQDALSLAAGLTAELLTALSAFDCPLTAVRIPSVTGEGPPALSGFNYQLRGNVRCHGDQVRACLTLLETSGETIAWSGAFSEKVSAEGLFVLLEAVAWQVASVVLDPHGVLFQAVRRQPAARLGTALAEFSYREYQERFSVETHRQAREALSRAITEEPGHAGAWALLSGVYLGEALFGFNREGTLAQTMDKCLEAARKAIALEPRSVTANCNLAMAYFYRGQRDLFLAASEQALCLAPRHPNNLAVIGMHLALAGDWERGVSLAEEASRLNPFHPPWYHLVFSLHRLHLRQFSGALAALGRFASVDFFPFQINLAVIHGHLGNGPEARKHLQRMFELWPDARATLREILDFWFPFGELAEVFAEGLAKAGFQSGAFTPVAASGL